MPNFLFLSLFAPSASVFVLNGVLVALTWPLLFFDIDSLLVLTISHTVCSWWELENLQTLESPMAILNNLWIIKQLCMSSLQLNSESLLPAQLYWKHICQHCFPLQVVLDLRSQLGPEFLRWLQARWLLSELSLILLSSLFLLSPNISKLCVVYYFF